VSEFQGQTQSGAYYTIALPDGWQSQDGLVIWNHGYQGYTQTQPEPNPSLGPLEDYVLEQGYAMAASSYSQTGWAVFNSHIDNQQLYEKFVELAGTPEKIILQGGSMGGVVSMRDLESGLIPEVDGAFLLCGAVAGAENWYNAFDLRMIYEAVCADVSGAELPTNSWFEQPGLVQGEIEFLDSLERCTGLISSEEVGPGGVLGALLRSSEQNERLNTILSVSQTDIEFLLLDLGYAVFEIPNLVNHSNKLNGLLPFDNSAIDYGDEDLNQKIQRSVALPSSRQKFLENYTPSGNIGSTKIVSIHTSKDGLVTAGNQRILHNLISANQLSTAIVVEEEPSHCGFSDAEGLAAWNSLRGWLENNTQPSAADIQANCQAGNSDAQQCRFDPNFAIPESVAVFPRANPAAILGNNTYDSADATISIEALKLAGQSGNYNLELLQSTGKETQFHLGNVEPSATLNSWQHQSLFIPEQLLLYVPGVRIFPSAESDPQFNLFMRYSSDAGQDKLDLLEFEAVNN